MNSSVLIKMNRDFEGTPSTASGFDIERSQKIIYRFLLDLVTQKSAEEVLFEFRALFFDYSAHPGNAEVMKELADIIMANRSLDFLYTLKRCCYILINNWETKRNYPPILQLIGEFSNLDKRPKTASQIVHRLRTWLKIFLKSKDYQDLLLFLERHEHKSCKKTETQNHWSQRYTSYLLVPQYVDADNPREQREAAQVLSQKLHQQFKFELAMYTTRSQLRTYRSKTLNNPTALGDEVLRLIKKILLKKGYFNYPHLAHLFLQQTQTLDYARFKQELQKYLLFSENLPTNHTGFKKTLFQSIESLYPERDDEKIDEFLLLRTCTKIFDRFTTEDGKSPSEIFLHFMIQGNPITLVILLLKLLLICSHARTHLEKRIAELIEYYKILPEEECQWAIDFFEVFKITFTIYADRDVQYSLIEMRKNLPDESSEEAILDAYWVFSQSRGY
jgi:hypothetical protein